MCVAMTKLTSQMGMSHTTVATCLQFLHSLSNNYFVCIISDSCVYYFCRLSMMHLTLMCNAMCLPNKVLGMLKVMMCAIE